MGLDVHKPLGTNSDFNYVHTNLNWGARGPDFWTNQQYQKRELGFSAKLTQAFKKVQTQNLSYVGIRLTFPCVVWYVQYVPRTEIGPIFWKIWAIKWCRYTRKKRGGPLGSRYIDSPPVIHSFLQSFVSPFFLITCFLKPNVHPGSKIWDMDIRWYKPQKLLVCFVCPHFPSQKIAFKHDFFCFKIICSNKTLDFAQESFNLEWRLFDAWKNKQTSHGGGEKWWKMVKHFARDPNPCNKNQPQKKQIPRINHYWNTTDLHS